MGVHASCFVTVVIIANELIDKHKTSRDSLSYKSWAFNNE
jgi:hypothetical protein